MDGGARLLRSLSALALGIVPGLSQPRLAVPGAAASVARLTLRDRRVRRGSWRNRADRFAALVAARPKLFGVSFGLCLFGAVGIYGAICGGEYADFVAQNGTLPDYVARLLGYDIKAVTISGIRELSETEVLDIAGVTPKRSLLLIDASDMRRRLLAQPLIAEAAVTKLFPGRLVITLTERVPVALWQKDGDVSIVGADGLVIDKRRDDHHDDLPFVAGEGANLHVADYLKLLAAAGDLRTKIRAGTWIGERRWNLVMTSGLVVKLPEIDAPAALAKLVEQESSTRILEKDIVEIDLRMPGRLIVRLTEEAAAARAALAARKPGKRGGPT